MLSWADTTSHVPPSPTLHPAPSFKPRPHPTSPSYCEELLLSSIYLYFFSVVTWAFFGGGLSVSCHTVRLQQLLWTLWGFKAGGGKVGEGPKRKDSASFSLHLISLAAVSLERIMQHLSPWRAVLLVTVLCQPGITDKYGKTSTKTMILIMMLRMVARNHQRMMSCLSIWWLHGDLLLMLSLLWLNPGVFIRHLSGAFISSQRKCTVKTIAQRQVQHRGKCRRS